MAWKLGPYTLDEDTVDADKNRQVVGSYTVPNFISPEGIIVLDDQGVPKQFGEKKTVLHLTIPDSIDGPRPIILYGHGFLGSSKEGTRGSYNKLCREHRFSSIGSFFGFNDQMTTKALTILTSDLGNVAQIDADVLQTFVNYTVLGRLVREKLAAEISKTVAGKTINPIDADRVYYMGISNGGTFGYVVAATQPKLSRAVMVVGGGGLVHFLQRSVVWNGYQPFIDVVFKENAINAQLAFAILQTGLDPIEPMNYVSRLVENRFPGRESMQAALHMAVNDSQVDNLVSEWVFRTAKVPMITPSPKPIWGVDTIIAPPPDGAPKGTKAALFVYDEHLLPSPPGNVPPPTDNHAHNSVRKLVAYETQVAEFLETGRFIQVCSGACDPD